MLSPGEKVRLRDRMVLDVAKLTRATVEAVGKGWKPSRQWQNDLCVGRNAGSLRWRCGGPHEFWRSWCGAAVPNVLVSFLRCLTTARMLDASSLLVIGRIIKELNETVFALNFLETGSTDCSESCEKVAYSISSTGLSSPALDHLHSTFSDFRPPSVAESGEAVLRRLLASRAIGGYSLTARGSLTLFQSSRVARPQVASKAPYLVSLFEKLSSFLPGYVQAAYASSCC